MAKQDAVKNGNGASAKPAMDRSYTVVRVRRENGKLTALEIVADVTAKSPIKATDQVVDSLPVGERTGEFGAFLTRSLTTDEYETEQTVITRKKKRGGVSADA